MPEQQPLTPMWERRMRDELDRLRASAVVEILPLDHARLLGEAKPVKNGKVQADPGKVEARHDSQVRAALRSGPCSLLIRGGATT
jgi:hypothetical protein